MDANFAPVVRILYLDDDKPTACLLKSFLEASDQDLHACLELVFTKDAYLKALQSQDFHVILSDFAMPGYDGYEALRDAKTLCPDVPFIMVTGELGEERAIETFKQGATDYVLKDRLQRLVPSIKRALKDAASEQNRRKGERELAVKTAELREAQRLAHIGSWYWDRETDATTGSEELLRIYGFDPATESMPAFRDQRGTCYPPEDWERVNAAARQAVETGIGYELDVRAIRNGAFIWVTTRGEAVRDGDGRIIGLRGTVQDVTERKNAESRIATLASFPELDPNPILEVDKSGAITYANKAATKLLADLGSRLGLEEFLPADTAGLLSALDRTEGPETHYREVTIGNRIFGEHIYRVKELGVVRFYALDITERRQAEEARRLSEEKYAIAFENNPAVISVTRFEDGVYLEVNDTWVAMTGYTREEVIGRSARKMPIWPSQDDVARFVQEIREHGFVRGREQEFRKKSGEPFLVEMSSQLLTIQGEKVILSTMVDITERKRMEAALLASEANLRLMANEAAEAMMVVDAAGVIEAASSLGSHLLGYKDGELIGKRAEEMAMTFSRLEAALMLSEVRKRAGKPLAATVRVKKKDGELQTMSLTVSVVSGGSSAEKYVVKFQSLGIPVGRNIIAP